MQAEIRQLLTRHCATLPGEVRDLATHLAWIGDIDATRPDAGLLAEAIAQAHKIKGSSGSIGFAEVSAAARTLETTLREVQAAPGFGDAERERIRAHLLALTDRIAAMRPEDSRLYSVDLSGFERLE